MPHMHRDMLVVLESTTYPGTTEEMLRPILEKSGLKCGVDFFLAFSPERVDPGNAIYKTKNTPKVVGGVTPECTDIAATLYEAVLEAPVHRVSSPAVAEMEKILENTYRNVNIGLINELAILCNRMGINIWEVVEAAKSKPYGFQAFYPGPGLGGHCIPLDPYYLSWKAREFGFHTSMIESSMIINDRMPEYCAQRAMGALNERRKAMNGAKVLVLGVAYMFLFSGTGLQNTLLLMILCNIVHYFSTPYLMMKNSLSKMNAGWETTAMLMGDSWLQTILRVVTPNALSSLIEVFSYYFINSMVTISALIFIAGARTMVLTTMIKQLQYVNRFNEVFVLSLLILATNLIAKAIFTWLANKSSRKGSSNAKKRKEMKAS